MRSRKNRILKYCDVPFADFFFNVEKKINFLTSNADQQTIQKLFFEKEIHLWLKGYFTESPKIVFTNIVTFLTVWFLTYITGKKRFIIEKQDMQDMNVTYWNYTITKMLNGVVRLNQLHCSKTTSNIATKKKTLQRWKIIVLVR